MRVATAHQARRQGATAVETALVMIPLTMLIFGICEYGRLLLDMNLLDNAAREGCRYALANNTSTTISSDVQTVVTTYMAGRSTSFVGSTVTATVSGTHSGVSTSVNNLQPGDPITVSVTGNYKFMNIIPLLSMTMTFPLTSSVTMTCEGGT